MLIRVTDIPAYSDTLWTWVKCYCKRGVTLTDTFYLQRSCQVYGSISLSFRPSVCSFISSLIHSWHVWYFVDIGTFGHSYVCFMWLPGKCGFLGNVTSRERWLPGKGDFLGKVTSWERWLPGKGDSLEKVTSWKRWLPENWTSREIWLPGNQLPGKDDFPENAEVG